MLQPCDVGFVSRRRGERAPDVGCCTHREEGGGLLMFECCTQHARSIARNGSQYARNMAPEHFFYVIPVYLICEDSFLCCEHIFGCCEASDGTFPLDVRALVQPIEILVKISSDSLSK
jgi:hypothetical protein